MEKTAEKIVAFDVETPNHRNDRICAIGITLIEDGQISDTFSYIVNPECEFDAQNVRLHGIRPEDAAGVPAFPDIWEKLRELFRTCLVAAHNANFDLCVLRKTLAAYGVTESLLYYVDTLQIAQRVDKNVENHKLSTLCKHFCIPLEPHDAGSDSYACAKLLCLFLEAGVDLGKFTRAFRFDAPASSAREGYRTGLSESSSALLTLNGILSGIACDDVLSGAELGYLQAWLDENIALKGNYPYDKIYSTLTGALADGVLTAKESQDMLSLFKRVTDPVGENACDCGALDLEGKNVCLTGEFDFGSKEAVAGKLAALGANIQNSVTGRTDILVLGGQGSAAWSAGNYGNKVKKALEMKEKGADILIVAEAGFFAALED
ncbi:MAG TPA: exonuclease domain-containing protein [Terriglobales bacterium]|nr:exonuclease domain-containing protein [Terriglobales bacterium]